MNAIKTIFTYNEMTLTDFFTFHLIRKDKMRWIYYGVSLVFFILGIVISFIFKRYYFGLLILILSISMFLLFPVRAKKAAKKTANSRYKRAPQEIIFTEERIEQHLEKQIYVYKWDMVKEVDETTKYIYFYISKVSAIIVIKDCLISDEYNSLITLVKERNIKYFKYNI